MNLTGKNPVFEGANTGLTDSKTLNISEGAEMYHTICHCSYQFTVNKLMKTTLLTV